MTRPPPKPVTVLRRGHRSTTAGRSIVPARLSAHRQIRMFTTTPLTTRFCRSRSGLTSVSCSESFGRATRRGSDRTALVPPMGANVVEGQWSRPPVRPGWNWTTPRESDHGSMVPAVGLRLVPLQVERRTVGRRVAPAHGVCRGWLTQPSRQLSRSIRVVHSCISPIRRQRCCRRGSTRRLIAA